MPRHQVEFASGRGPIEITYTRDGTGAVSGEAYFKQDDFLAPLDGEGSFTHPMSGTQYRVHLPFPGMTRSTDAILEVREWRHVARSTPWTLPGA